MEAERGRSGPRAAAGTALEEAEGSDQERQSAAEGARVDLGDRRAAVLETEQAGELAEGECLAAEQSRPHPAQPARSAPVTGSECIVTAPRAGAVNATVVASDHLGYGPTDLAEGDSVVYSKAHHEGVTCIVRVNANGKITINSKNNGVIVLDENGKITIDAAAGQDVVVNGGTLKVARVTDLTTCGVLQFNTVGVGVLTGTYTDPDGGVAPFTLGVPINLVGRIAPGAGATRFKA
jgi:hypothetical protein